MSQQINLFNPSLVPQREWATGRNVLYFAGGLAVLLLVVGIGARWHLASTSQEAIAAEQALSQTRSQLESAQQALAAKRIPLDKDAELLKLQQDVTDREQILALLERGSPQEGMGFADYFRGLARQSLAGLWLVGFSAESGGNGLEIRGRMTDQSLLPEYIRRLNHERAFAGREFAALDVRQPPLDKGDAAAVAAAQKLPPYVDFVLKPLRSGTAGAADRGEKAGDKDGKGGAQ